MEEKRDEIEGLKPFRMMSSSSSSPPSVLKPFVDGGIAGLLSGSLCGAIDYSICIHRHARFQNHPDYVHHCLKLKMIPGMVLVDAFAFSQVLGIHNIVRGIAVARNDGARPSLYQEAASGLIAGVATAYLRFPFDVICHQRHVESLRNLSVLQLLREGGPMLKMNAGFGAGMVAAYNPSVFYLTETHGFSEQGARYGAEVISGFSTSACAQLAKHASFSSVRQTLESRGPLAFFEGFSSVFFRTCPAVVLFWRFLDAVQVNFQPPSEA